MIKSISCAIGAVAFGAVAAVAGPYVNTEANLGWSGTDYSGSVTDLHLGYEHSEGAYNVYVQGGPAIVQPDAGDSDVEFSGKLGGSVAASENFSFYTEISEITVYDENSYGGKLRAKYRF